MKLKYFYPSFEMRVKSHDPDQQIELEGENNWYLLVVVHSMMAILAGGIFLYHRINYVTFPASILPGIILLTILSVSCGVIFGKARNAEYQKIYIRFSPEGIYFNHTQKTGTGRLIQRDTINDYKVIYDGKTYKFVLFGLVRPYFEFSVAVDQRFNADEFLASIGRMLNMEMVGVANLSAVGVVEYVKSNCADAVRNQIDQTIDNHGRNTQKNIMDPSGASSSDLSIQPFKPKGFYHYNRKGLFVIRAFYYDDRALPAKKIWLSRENKELWHRQFLLVKEKFKFSEVAGLAHKISSGSRSNDYEVSLHLKARIYLLTADNRRKKIFVFEMPYEGSSELAELAILKEVKYLTLLLQKEIGISMVNSEAL